MPGDSLRSEDVSPEEKLLTQLRRSNVVEVLGVIDANGMTGSSSRGDKPGTLLFSLAVWKYPGEPVQNRKLTVRKKVVEDEITSTLEPIGSYDVVHLKARVAEDSIFGTPQALLVEILGKHNSDDELNECAQKLQEPVTFEDAEFGKFVLDRRVDWFVAETTWGTATVKLNLAVGGCKNTQQALTQARELWDSRADWSRRILEFAVAKLLKVKNEAWLEDAEAELSKAQFKSRMTLESITVYPEGKFEFWYDDGELFWEHSIMVSGHLTKGPTQAGIHG
jgi:hypothetical protein